MEWLFSLIEAPLVWLSGRFSSKPEARTLSKTGMGRIVETDEPFDLSAPDLSRHCYILGSTGCGKTTLILKLIEADLVANHSIVILDLRGDLVAGTLGLCDALDIDPSRVKLLDLREKSRIQGFNPLSGAGEPYIRALHVLDVVASEAGSWGVQLEESLRCALLLLATAQKPLSRLEAVFYDESFRNACLSGCNDESLVLFWTRYTELSPQKQQSWALPVLNKVTSLMAVPSLRLMLGDALALDLGDVLSGCVQKG